MIIFVYGTLLKGQKREAVLANSRYIGPAIMNQTELFDLGAFPGITEGKGIVIGELYDVNAETMHILDKIEGYNENNLVDSLFVRKKIKACKFIDGKSVDVFCYFYNDSIPKNRIAHGDYRRYRIETDNKDQWILAYGSNLSSQRLIKRVDKIKKYKIGFIEGFKLVFNIQDSEKPVVYANIAYVGTGEKCPAVAYKLSPKQASILDEFEHIPKYYFRIATPFCDDSGNKTIMQVYIANPDRLVKEQSPEPEYFDYIESGYKEHGLNLNYLKSCKVSLHSDSL